MKKRRLKQNVKYSIIYIRYYCYTVMVKIYKQFGLIIREYKVINDKLPASFNGLK